MAADYVGLSTDTKPTGATVPLGSKYWSTDINRIDEWDGDSWEPIKIGGAAITRVSASDVLDSATWSQPFSGTGVSDNDLLFTAADVSMFNCHTFLCTAGAADVEASVDGVTFSTTPVFLEDLSAESTTPGLYDLVNVMAAGRLYRLARKFKSYRVRQSGATAATVQAASSVI